MKWAVHAFALLGLATLCGSASAQDMTEDPPPSTRDASEARAQRLFALGSTAFEAEDFAEAAHHFRVAYELTGRSELLYNVGIAQQRGEEHEAARVTFERFLRDHPDATERPEVDARLRMLDSETAEGDEHNAGGVPAAAVTLTAMGGAAAMGGVMLLVLGGQAQSRAEDADGVPFAEVEDDDRHARLFGLTGGIALGVGAALLATGIVLFVARGGESEVSAGLGTLHWRRAW